MTISPKKVAASKKATTKTATPANKDLETEFPLSEKDEVKQAERRMSKAAKKN